MTEIDPKDLRWFSLALIPLVAEDRTVVDLPTAYVPPPEPGPMTRPRFAPSYPRSWP
jgi:hypothetical protein